jgi:hypothetical protein
MSLPTINDAQAVDPVLQNMLVGYMQDDSRFVAARVFPYVPTEHDSGTYYIATKKYFFLDTLASRAPGGDFAEDGYGLSTATFACRQFAAEIPLPDEVRANSQVPMDLEQVAMRKLAQANLIRQEVAFGADFMKINVWGNDDNNSTTDWDDFSAGDPAADVLTAKRTISNESGTDANTLVCGYIVHQALVNHPDLINRLVYVQGATMDNMEQSIGALLGVPNYLVAKATYSNTNEAATFSATAIIDDDALICFTEANPGVFGVTAGKTFAWGPGGGAGSAYSKRHDRNHTDLVQLKAQWDQKAVATDVGYFFADVV